MFCDNLHCVVYWNTDNNSNNTHVGQALCSFEAMSWSFKFPWQGFTEQNALQNVLLINWRILAWTTSVNGGDFALDQSHTYLVTHEMWVLKFHSDKITHHNQLFLPKQCMKSLKPCKLMWFTALFENNATGLSQLECRITVEIQQCKSWSHGVVEYEMFWWWSVEDVQYYARECNSSWLRSLSFYERAFVTDYIISLEQFSWAQRDKRQEVKMSAPYM